MADTQSWVISWFKKKGPMPGETPEEHRGVNYFEASLIDSLGVIELVADVEKQFSIRFSQSQFQDRRFSTIGGLSDLIEEMRKGQGK